MSSTAMTSCVSVNFRAARGSQLLEVCDCSVSHILLTLCSLCRKCFDGR